MCVWLKGVIPFFNMPSLSLCFTHFLFALIEMIIVHSKWTLVVVARLNKRQRVSDRQVEESPADSCRIFSDEVYGWRALPRLCGNVCWNNTTNKWKYRCVNLEMYSR